jgi:hypothetical protein
MCLLWYVLQELLNGAQATTGQQWTHRVYSTVPAKERLTERGPKSIGLLEECRRIPCSIYIMTQHNNIGLHRDVGGLVK